MHTFLKAGAFLALAASASGAQAQEQSACLTESEANALFVYSIPEVLDGVAKTCNSQLPQSAFMPKHSTETIARFRAAANGKWPEARAAFLKMSGAGKEDNAKVLESLPDSALQPFVAATLSTLVSKKIQPQDCRKVDRLAAALAPLAPGNVAALFTALVGMVGKDGFQVCEPDQ